MGGSTSSPAVALPEEAKQRLTSIELAELQAAFAVMAPGGSLDAQSMAAALPVGLPWERLHSLLVAAVAKEGAAAVPQPGALSYAGLVLGLARTIRARQPARDKMRFCRFLYAEGEDAPLGAAGLSALLRGALHASRSGEAAASTASEGFEASCAEAAALPADDWAGWAADQLPALHLAFEDYILGTLRGLGRPDGSAGSASAAREPILSHVLRDDQLEQSLLSRADAWLLSVAAGPATEQRGWRCLYSSSAHGLSLSRFAHHAVGYGGPTLLLARCAPLTEHGEREGVVLGAMVDSPWKASDKYFGGSDCALVQLAPHFHVYRPVGHSRNLAFFNLPADRAATFRARGQAQLPEVVGFGGQPAVGGFRLSLEDDLNVLSWRESDTCYARHPSQKLAEAPRTVLALELWGCGGLAAEEAQRELQRRRGLDAAKAGSLSLETRRKMAVDDHATKFVLEAGGAHSFIGDQMKESEDREARGVNRGERSFVGKEDRRAAV